MNNSLARAFTFGRNWQRFLRSYTSQRQINCQKALLSFLQTNSLKGKTFLDIGCGSGINSAAAWLAGADRVYSFDYDPNSVAATQLLHQHHGSPNNWIIAQGSVLNASYVRSLGKFDIVYAWGMLHHTGDQWQALRIATLAMHDQSLLYIALYAKEAQYPNWQHWIEIKQRYNRANTIEKRLMEIHYIWQTVLGKKLHNLITLPVTMWQYQNARGMDFMTDVRDWLGGWPTEFSSVAEVVDFSNDELGLELINLLTGEGNSEFLFAHKGRSEKLGYKLFDLHNYHYNIPVLDNANQLPPEPVWIFGALRGGTMVFDYLFQRNVAIAGFIDLEPVSDSLEEYPLIAFSDFIQSHSKSTPVILANRYVKENSARLRQAGFHHLFNAHPLIMQIHNG